MNNKVATSLSYIFLLFGILYSSDILSRELYVSAKSGSDSNPGTRERPVKSVRNALSLVKPGDSVVFSAGMYPCADEKMPDGHPGMTVFMSSDQREMIISVWI